MKPHWLSKGNRVHTAEFGSFSSTSREAIVSVGDSLALFSVSDSSSTENIAIGLSKCVYHSNSFGSIRILSSLPSTANRNHVFAVNSQQQWWILGFKEDRQHHHFSSVVLATGRFAPPGTQQRNRPPTLLRGNPTCTVSRVPTTPNNSNTNVVVVLLQLWTDSQALDALTIQVPTPNTTTTTSTTTSTTTTTTTTNVWQVDWQRISLESSRELTSLQLAAVSFTGRVRQAQTQHTHQTGAVSKNQNEIETKTKANTLYEHGVVIVLKERSKLPGAPSTKHVHLAYLNMNRGAIVVGSGEWSIQAVHPSTSHVFVLNETDAVLCVENSGCVLWTPTGCIGHQKVPGFDTGTCVKRACHVVASGNDSTVSTTSSGTTVVSHVLLLTSSGALAHVTVRCHMDPTKTARTAGLYTPRLNYTLSPIVMLETNHVDLVSDSILKCTRDHCSLVAATQGHGGLLQLFQISLTATPSAPSEHVAHISQQQILDVTGTEGCGNVVAATTVPMLRHQQDLSLPTHDEKGTLQHSSTKTSNEIRSLVVATQHNGSSGALLNGQYGYGFQVLAEIGSEMELGTPDIFAVNVMNSATKGCGGGGVLLLFSYTAEQHSQVLCMSEPGTFEALDLGLILNEASSTLAFGYDNASKRIIQIVPSGIHVGKLSWDSTSSAQPSFPLVWQIPNNGIAEHATLDDLPPESLHSSNGGACRCCLATKQEVMVLQVLVDSISVLTRISTAQPVSALTLSGSYLAYALWETGEIVVYCHGHQKSPPTPNTTTQTATNPQKNDPFTRCNCDRLCQSISITTRASGIRSLKFSTATIDTPRYLSCGTGDGHVICWDTRVFANADNAHGAPCGVFVVGTSPVQYIEWSTFYGFVAISGARGLLVLPSETPSQHCDATCVHASVLHSHHALCHIFTGLRDQCAATAGTAPLPPSPTTPTTPKSTSVETTHMFSEAETTDEDVVSLFAVVTSEGGLALVELDANTCMRWSRHDIRAGVPRHVAFHNATDTIVVSVTLANGNEVLRVHNAEDLQLLREIKMHPNQHVSVVETVHLNGRECIALVALVDNDGGNGTAATDSPSLPVAGRDVDHVESHSTLSLIIPVRRTLKKDVSLSVARTMTFEGRSMAVCTFDDHSIALALDNRVLLLEADTTTLKGLAVVTGLGSPNGGAVLCISRVTVQGTVDGLIVGEMCASPALFVLSADRRHFQLVGQDAMVRQGMCRRLCAQKEGGNVLFCDWATNTVHSLDANLAGDLRSKEVLRLESHAIHMFHGSLLPVSSSSMHGALHQEDFLVVSRDGSIVQVPCRVDIEPSRTTAGEPETKK